MSPRLVFCLTAAVLTVTVDADSIKTGNETVVLVQKKGNWSEAKQDCQNIYDGELVSANKQVSCSLANFTTESSSVWSGGYKVPAWVKTEGCFSVEKNLTQLLLYSLENCISTCKTRHVAFSTNPRKCLCLETISGLTKFPGINQCNECYRLDCNSILIYTVTNISIEMDLSDQSCVGLYIDCNEGYPTVLAANCSSLHGTVCENGESDQGNVVGIYNQPKAASECALHRGVIMTDFRKTCEAYNGSTAWTSIKLFWIDPVFTDQGLNDEHGINFCSYTFCKTGNSNSTSGKCNSILDGYACKMQDKNETGKKEIFNKMMETVTSPYTNEIPGPNSTTKTISLDYITPSRHQTSSGNILSYHDTTSTVASGLIKTTYISTEIPSKKVETSNGTTIGIIVAVVVVASLTIVIVVMLLRRSKRKSPNQGNSTVSKKKSQHGSSENYESPWDSEDSKTNPLVFQGVLSMSVNGSASMPMRKPDIDLTTYAVVNKPTKTETAFQVQELTAAFHIQVSSAKSDSTIKNKTEIDAPEDEYDRLDRISNPAKIETLSENVYDSASGSRDTEDVTYNSMDHDGSWREGKASINLNHYS